jgi:hypothetical protein
VAVGFRTLDQGQGAILLSAISQDLFVNFLHPERFPHRHLLSGNLVLPWQAAAILISKCHCGADRLWLSVPRFMSYEIVEINSLFERTGY